MNFLHLKELKTMKIILKANQVYTVVSNGVELIKGKDLMYRKDIKAIYVFGKFHDTREARFSNG